MVYLYEGFIAQENDSKQLFPKFMNAYDPIHSMSF
jgi:hypothetical protein